MELQIEQVSISRCVHSMHCVRARNEKTRKAAEDAMNEMNQSEEKEEDVFAYTQKIIPDACDFSASRKIANEAFHSNRFLLLLNDHYYDGFSPLPTRFPLIKTKLISESTRIVFV